MSQLFPAPVDTPIVNKDSPERFTETWMRFFKTMSDAALAACSLKNGTESKKFKYSVNANICFCVYSSDTALDADLTVSLPFPSMANFTVGPDVYPTGTKSVVIKSGTTTLQFWAFVDTSS